MLTVLLIRVKTLSHVLNKGRMLLPQRDLTNEQKELFADIIGGCQSVLNPLREKLEQYQKLDMDLKSSTSCRSRLTKGGEQ